MNKINERSNEILNEVWGKSEKKRWNFWKYEIMKDLNNVSRNFVWNWKKLNNIEKILKIQMLISSKLWKFKKAFTKTLTVRNF